MFHRSPAEEFNVFKHVGVSNLLPPWKLIFQSCSVACCIRVMFVAIRKFCIFIAAKKGLPERFLNDLLHYAVLHIFLKLLLFLFFVSNYQLNLFASCRHKVYWLLILRIMQKSWFFNLEKKPHQPQKTPGKKNPKKSNQQKNPKQTEQNRQSAFCVSLTF